MQAAKKNPQGKAGQFFPLTAVQKFEDGIFENGVFLGELPIYLHLYFLFCIGDGCGAAGDMAVKKVV